MEGIMFELPEMLVLSRQMNETLRGKTIAQGMQGNSPHKFVWYNHTHEEFEELTKGKVLGEACARGRWLFLNVEPGYVLVLGELGGKILYHPAGSKEPNKYHLLLRFDDDSFLTVMIQMWGAIELYPRGEELNRQYVRDMRPVPGEPDFTYEHFTTLIDEVSQKEKKSAKGLLTQDQLLPGLGNSIAQDILFRARLHPRHLVGELDGTARRELYDAVLETVDAVAGLGGRYDELDLYGSPGGYVRLMDKNAAGKPCPECETTVEKIQFLGGSCYFCPSCQK
jgi:formamidopyrimidine-DNA glycosylase